MLGAVVSEAVVSATDSEEFTLVSLGLCSSSTSCFRHASTSWFGHASTRRQGDDFFSDASSDSLSSDEFPESSAVTERVSSDLV